MHLLVFDSGIGGLGVVREIRRLQPYARITYLADNGFFPYGDKADNVLLDRITRVIGRAIVAFKPDAVVVACNTASTIALETLRTQYNRPFIGCVPPVKPAAAASSTRHIGIIATPATITRDYLRALVEDFAKDCVVHQLGAPHLAALAERKFCGEQINPVPCIAPLFEGDGALIDAVALGCTHYIFVLDELRAAYPAITWFDPGEPVARRTAAVTSGLNAAPRNGDDAAYFTTDLTDLRLMKTALQDFGFRQIFISHEYATPTLDL